MDESYFSLMPFPLCDLRTLKHLLYSAHRYWLDNQGIDPYHVQADYGCVSLVGRKH